MTSEEEKTVENGMTIEGEPPDSACTVLQESNEVPVEKEIFQEGPNCETNYSSDQSSPRAVLDIVISSGDSEDSCSSNSSSRSLSMKCRDRPDRDLPSLKWRSLIRGLLLRKKKSMRRLSTFPPAEMMIQGGESMGTLQPAPKGRPSWRSFDYQELAAATDDFSPGELIGKGGHAEVYKGYLPDGQLVAVKRLTKGNTEDDRTQDFLSELGIIAHVDHPNTAQLLGFSVEGGLHLVLKFSPHGSLASLLHGSEKSLDWSKRFKIAVGIAEGLRYLHEGCHRRIIHRDIKASNILLTEDYQPQISDFGLAKWLPEKWSHHTVFPIEGTFGYLAPEYFMHGIVNEKIDVFAFGVILLELITGRRAVDNQRQSLVIWAKPLLKEKNIKDLADPSLEGKYDDNEMMRAISVASLCIHHLSTSRPTMNLVLKYLRGEVSPAESMRREVKPGFSRLLTFDACDMEEYTSSRYLKDLNRHKQLAMEQ